MDQRNTPEELRRRIAEGRYEIDPALVADAIIRHRSSLAADKRAEVRHADRARQRRLVAIRRSERRRSRGPAQRLAA